MGVVSRMKSLVGAAQPGVTLASTTNLAIPDHRNYFIVTGTTTITTIIGANHIRDRKITIRGGTSAHFTLTDSGTTTTAGHMNLAGYGNMNVQQDDCVELFLKGDNTWVLVDRAA